MADFTSFGVLLIFVGFAVVTLSLLTSRKDAGVKGSGVVMIGPVPIVFASDAKWASLALFLAIILVVLMFLIYMV